MAELNVYTGTKLKIDFGGNILGNIAEITPDYSEKGLKYDVTTMDGVRHKKYRYKKINQTVQFLNLLDGVYDELKNIINAREARNMTSHVGFPEAEGFVYNDYYVSIVSEIPKGYLDDGTFFKNGMIVLFEAVNPE